MAIRRSLKNTQSKDNEASIVGKETTSVLGMGMFPVIDKTHPLDMLLVGNTYTVDNLIGSIPDLNNTLVGGRLVHYSHQTMCYYAKSAPTWHHISAQLYIEENNNDLGKCLVLTANVDKDEQKTTSPYGLVNQYKLKLYLKKGANDRIFCTRIEGVSGEIGVPWIIPSYVLTPEMRSLSNPNYKIGTAHVPLNLPITLTVKDDNTVELKIQSDPMQFKTRLPGTVLPALLTSLNSLGLVKEMHLTGKIHLKPVLELEETQNTTHTLRLSKKDQ